MDAHKAHAIGIDPSDVRITTEGRRYGRNMWVAWVPDDRPGRGGRYVCTQSRDVFDLTRWLSDLRALHSA
jgi:hypothetical protein